MPEWVVVLLALAAAVTSALGIVIRQRATLEIPQDEGVSTTMFKKLLRNRLWWAGTAVAASGYGFQALALTWGSLILVAPLLVSALLFALPMSARLAHRRVTAHDWVWALVLTLGLAVFLTIARVQPGNYRPPPVLWILVTVLCVVVVLGCVIGGARTEGRNRALLIATAVGVLFGVVSVLTKVTVQRLNEEGMWGTLLIPAPVSRRDPRRGGNPVAAVGVSRRRAAGLGAHHVGARTVGRGLVGCRGARRGTRGQRSGQGWAAGGRGRGDGGGDDRARSRRGRVRRDARGGDGAQQRRRRPRPVVCAPAGRRSPRTPPACRSRRRGRRTARRTGPSSATSTAEQTPLRHSRSISTVNRCRCRLSTASSFSRSCAAFSASGDSNTSCAVLRELNCHVGHFGERDADLVGQRMVGMTQPGDVGDVHGQRAHPLDVGADMQRADDLSEIACHRLLQREQPDRAAPRSRRHLSAMWPWSVMTCSASSRSACSRACDAWSIASAASPHIRPIGGAEPPGHPGTPYAWPVKYPVLGLLTG